ncbi:MAG: sugar ABC transporter ATP-binding protein [Oscillospiraceae bacterium]
MAETILAVKGICKSFGPTRALANVDFILKRGEIHGLIGENGSGKSTLSSIIAGIHAPDSGEMQLYGEQYVPKSVADAQSKGVAMIVQEMGTAASISVAENIFLGNEHLFTKYGLVRRKTMREAAQQALEAVGAGGINAGMPAGALDPEERKVVEIAKAMRPGPEVLIVDETTTALTQDGRELLYSCIEKMRSEDKGVILISHDLEEIMNVCTTLTVLRDGVIIGTLTREEFDADRIKAMMVGREISGNLYRSDYDGSSGDEVVLTAEHLTGHWQVTDVNFELHRGEILGIGGLSGGGIHELGRLLFGMEKAVVGEARLADGSRVTGPNLAVKKGLGYVSKNRDEEAVMLGASIRNNAVLPSLGRLARGGIAITRRSEKNLANQVIDKMEVKCSSMEQLVASLSGGNKQKVSFGKWLGCGAKVLILDCPTRGIDIGVKQAMYQLIYELKTTGYSFVLISEELPELIGMSDRILILKDGCVAGEYDRSETLSEHDLIQVMV